MVWTECAGAHGPALSSWTWTFFSSLEIEALVGGKPRAVILQKGFCFVFIQGKAVVALAPYRRFDEGPLPGPGAFTQEPAVSAPPSVFGKAVPFNDPEFVPVGLPEVRCVRVAAAWLTRYCFSGAGIRLAPREQFVHVWLAYVHQARPP